MSGRCSLGGHKVYFNEQDAQWHYEDNDEVFDICNERPCVKCGKAPTEDGHDSCIANLGQVINACCGHGASKGYIQFDNGITVRGYFEIERDCEKTNDGVSAAYMADAMTNAADVVRAAGTSINTVVDTIASMGEST